MIEALCRHAAAAAVGSLSAAALLTAFQLPAFWLPVAFAVVYAILLRVQRPVPLARASDPLDRCEWALLAFAAAIGLLRVFAYAREDIFGHFVPALTWDDNWHFQEIASLVTTDSFPPRANFAPGSYLHFYYLPFVPAAALAQVTLVATGTAWIKLSYALTALAINVAAAAALILFIRHVLPAHARRLAILAVLLAGAAPDGLCAISNWLDGALLTSETWQARFGIRTQFSTLSTMLIWVPHHLMSAAALLIAVVTATEPGTLAVRNSTRAIAIAGLLTAFSAFASIFVFIGGAVALLPVLWRVLGVPRLIMGLAPAVLLALPLAYIYLNAEASGGVILAAPYVKWQSELGGVLGGCLGLAVAAYFILAEAGWLAVLAHRGERAADSASALAPLGACSALFLASAVVISFAGSNNYAMRGSVLPILVLACWWAGTAAGRYRGFAGMPGAVRLAAAAACALAVAAHANEVLLYGRSVVHASLSEPDACQSAVLAANADPSRDLDASFWPACAPGHASYSLTRPFEKPRLAFEDREILGAGPLLWGAPVSDVDVASHGRAPAIETGALPD